MALPIPLSRLRSPLAIAHIQGVPAGPRRSSSAASRGPGASALVEDVGGPPPLQRRRSAPGWARGSRHLLTGLVALCLLLSARTARAQETIEYYGVDALGSIRVVFDQTGAVTARSDYLPFGESYAPFGNLPPQRFTGQQRDGDEGFDYFNARSYHVRTGRFEKVDPVFAGLFQPQAWNRYAYALNNPLTFTDPTGLNADACTQDGYINEAGELVWNVQNCESGQGGGSSGGGSNWSSVATWFFLRAADLFTGAVAVGGDELVPSRSTAYKPPPEVEKATDTVLLVGALALSAKSVGGALLDAAASKVVATTVEAQLTAAATRAVATVGAGRGGAYGTRVHSAFAGEVRALGYNTEVSYLMGLPVSGNPKGSIRVDVVVGPIQAPAAIFDLKTGGAFLSQRRITQIQSHLPGGASVPVIEVRPKPRP